MSEQFTVDRLIAALRALPPQHRVRFGCACCSHPAGVAREDEEGGVVIGEGE